MQFELYSCKVNIGSKKSMIVGKIGVTAPQMVVLRRVHGPGSVTEIEAISPTRFTLRQKLRAGHTDAQELEFLAREYDAHIVDGAPAGTNVVSLIWPGLQAVLPRSVLEIPAENTENAERATASVDALLREDPGADLDAVPEATAKGKVLRSRAPVVDMDGPVAGI